jgi:mannose-6-phosphate isomerase-like protein (cupin superfamily)
MKLYSFKQDTSKHITAFESNFSMARILNHDGHTHIGYAYVPPNGEIGKHEAVVSQLFLVIEGSGIVNGSNDEHATIETGQAVYWEKGLTAFIIESPNMENSVYMKLLL